MAAGELVPGATRDPGSASALPAALRRCNRVVVATVHAQDLLLDASGLLQRLGSTGVPVDVLVAADATEEADDAAAAGFDELRVAGLERHRLALPAPFGADREDDVVAALSELVGFDPEPGLFCLAPAADGRASSRQTVGAAASRIAWVYGLPLVGFSAPADGAATGLDLEPEEWTRKYAGLAACAAAVAPLSGRREYFTVQPAGPRPSSQAD
jgi:hypothetical protein